MKFKCASSCFVTIFLALAVVQADQQKQAKEPKLKHAGKVKTSKDSPPTKQKRIVTDLSGFELVPKVDYQAMMVGGGTGAMLDDGRVLVPPAPMLAKVYDPTPVFAWGYWDSRTEDYVFILGEPRGARLLHADRSRPFPSFLFTLTYESMSSDLGSQLYRVELQNMPQLRYPGDAPMLQSGKTYLWWVRSNGLRSSIAAFVVVSRDEQQEIENALKEAANSDPYQDGLARARVFTKYRLWYDALAAYTDLIRRFPDCSELYEERGTIFAQIGTSKLLAEWDFAHADELRYATGTPR